MSTHQEVLEEEFEVLNSIFPDELEKISDDALRIRVEPEETFQGDALIVSLEVTYTPTYPDSLPHLSLSPLEGELTPSENDRLIKGMQETGEESLGMAMVFTLTSWLKEALVDILKDRERARKEEEDRKYKEFEEAEAARKRGTAVTLDSFLALQKRLLDRAKAAKKKEEEDKVKSLTGKEREEYRRYQTRLSGRQLFETGKTSAAADLDLEDDDAPAEFEYNRYTREERELARQKEEDRREEERAKGGVDVYDSD